jgi:hypothetical protein
VLADNTIAQRAFMKNGYQRMENSTKKHREQIMTGYVFRKILSQVGRQ